jgi:hypothetical protein
VQNPVRREPIEACHELVEWGEWDFASQPKVNAEKPFVPFDTSGQASTMLGTNGFYAF